MRAVKTRLLWFVKGLFAPYYRTILRLSQALGLIGSFFDRSNPELDVVFVVPPEQSGWILEGIAREIAKYFPGKLAFHGSVTRLPPAKAYFFVHFSLLPKAYKLNPSLWRRRVFVWHTHPRDDLGISEGELTYVLRKAALIFCACSEHARQLVANGLSPDRVKFVIGGADPDRFLSHRRGGGTVGFCSAYYPRKAPDTLFRIVQLMPNTNFLLIGRGWQDYKRFEELTSLPNFRYLEAQYSAYPSLYGQMDVFVSVSQLEGGPIPLIEAMMSNVVPVCSRTGFGPDVIQHEVNGFLFDVNARPEEVCSLIVQAQQLNYDVRSTVLHCSWENFGTKVSALMGFVPNTSE
jgi:glycosyltransferase involved in cell wall biosynthesis